LKIEYKTSDAGPNVKFIEEHSASKWLGLVAALLFLPFFGLYSSLGVATYFGIAFLLAIIFGRLYVLFGVSGLQLTEDGLTLVRSLFFLRTTPYTSARTLRS
jgi:hypothetical protein